MTKNLLESHGFTVIELITVISIMAILGGFTFAFIDQLTNVYLIGSKQRMIYQEASYILERISREARDAQSVSLDSATNGLRIVKPGHSTNSIVSDSSLTVLFYKNPAGEMVRSSSSIPNMVMAKNVRIFTPFPASCAVNNVNCIISITLELTDSNMPVDDPLAQSVTLSTKISPKNIIPSSGIYTNRCFNGDYEDVVQ